MALWQVLRAGKAKQAALGYRAHHGPGGLERYSTAPAAAVASDSSRSFCLSREKVTMQQLNSRLASYLQQVQYLEAANQKLECQIQKELDRKCPQELRELDGHLRTVSLLQDQIGDCLSAQAEVKLHLLSAELTIFDFTTRWEKERECRGCLEVELSTLRQLEEELQVHRLPELQCRLKGQTQELMGMQIQHEQDMQGLLAQMSGGITVEMQPDKSLDLIQQLDDLRRTNETLLENNQNERWFNTQVSMLTSDPADLPESEVIHAELVELRRTAGSLEEELTQLQALNVVLEASGQEQHESLFQELMVLQHRADGLCQDLDSVLQAVAQQAVDHQTLLDVKTRLETEIRDYRRLLDGLSPQGVATLHGNSAPNVTSFCVTTSPSAFRRNITVNQTVNVQGGNLRTMEAQAVSRGHIRTVGQTPAVAPLSANVTAIQSISFHSKHPKNSPARLINTSNLTGSFHKSENQRTGAPPERAGRESMTISEEINRQSSPSILSTQVSQGLDKGAVVKASTPETNTAQGITTLASARSDSVEAKPEPFISKQTTTEAGLQANKTETIIQTEITRTIVCAEPEVKQGPHETITDPSKQTSAEVKKETETVESGQVNCTEGSIQAKNQDPAEVVSLSVKTQAEAVRDAREVAVTASCVSGSHVLGSEEVEGKVSGDLTLIIDKNIERQEKEGEEKVEGALPALGLDQSLALSDSSNSEQDKVIEDADTGPGIAAASSGSPDSNDKLESKTAQGVTTLLTDAQSARSDSVEAKSEPFTSKQTTTEAGLQANKTETIIQTEITRTIVCAEPEVKQGPHVTITDPSKQTSAEVKKETETVESGQVNCTEGSIQAKNQDPAEVVSESLETPTEAVRDAGEVTASCVSGSHVLGSEEVEGKVSGDLTLIIDKNIERQEKEGEEDAEGTLPVLGLDQSAALSDSSNSKQDKVIEDADTGPGIAAASSVSPDSNDKLESKTAQGVTTLLTDAQSARSDSVEAKPEPFTSKQTSAEVKKETETVESGQANCTEGSIQTKNQDPAEVVSESLETPTEAVRDAGEVTTSCVSGSKVLGSEEAQGKVSGDLIDDKDIERQEKKGEEGVEGALPALGLDQSLALSDSSNSKQDKVMEDADTGPGIAAASPGSPDSNDNHESKTASTKILKKVELEMNKGKVVNGFHDTSEVQVDPTVSDNEMVNPAGQEALLTTTTTTKPVACLSPEISPSPVEKEVLMSMTECLSPNVEDEDEEDSLSLTEANPQMRPVEKYILSTKEESQPLLFSKDQALPEEDRNRKVSISMKDGNSVSFEGNKESRGANISKPISRGFGCQLSSSLGGFEIGGPGHRSIIADKEGQHGFGGQNKDSGVIADKKDVQNPGDQKETSSEDSEVRGQNTTFTGVASNSGGVATSNGGMASDLAASFGTVANSSGPVNGNAEATTTAGMQGRFRRSSGEWMLYRGSLGHTSMSLPNTGSKESPSATTLPATSQHDTGRFSSRGSGEWMVYGGSLGSKSSLDCSTNLPSEGKEEGPASSPQERGRFGSSGSGEWRVYGGSTGRISSRSGSSSLTNADREKSPSVAAQLATSPPGSHGAGRFGSGGSGEWRVYGGSTGRLSRASSADRVSVSASQNRMFSPPGSHTGSGPRLRSAGSGGKRSSSVGSGGRLSSSGSGGRLSSSSGSHRTSTSGRFTSTGSGEWKPVYSSANARKSSAGSSGRSGGGGTSQRISNPGGVSMGSGGRQSSSTAGGNFMSSAGSGSKLSSAGGSDRVSSQAGRISSSPGSGRTNSTGGRVISSSDRPIRSTGSGAGGNKERISVCKMAALSISAAGRERSQDKQRQAQQQAAAAATLLQRWLTTGVEVKSADPDGLDDIMRP